MENYDEFAALRAAFRKYCLELSGASGQAARLKELQREIIGAREGARYELVNPVVYNTALDEMDSNSDIRLILVGDNPGRREQQEGRYLIGPSGRLAGNFFKNESSLCIDFRKNVLILNKTPVHTPRTIELRTLCRLGGAEMRAFIEESQVKMALLLRDFYLVLKTPVWITGYSEMKKNGVFGVWTDMLSSMMEKGEIRDKDVFVYRHFSMNQFTADLNRQKPDGESTAAALNRIGAGYRNRIFGR